MKRKKNPNVIDLVSSTPELIDLITTEEPEKNYFFKKLKNSISKTSTSSSRKKRTKTQKSPKPKSPIRPMLFLESEKEKKKIKPMTMSHVSSETRKRRIEEITKRNAAKKISRNFKKDVFHANYLKAVCSDSGDCMSFGKEISVIKRLFEGFKNFVFIASPIKRIGQDSVNGIINQIHFQRNNYNAYAILKSSINETSDNLMYEYEVGKNLINYYTQVFPCFVETYALFNLYGDINKLQKQKVLSVNEFKNLNLIEQNIHYLDACREPIRVCILTQHIKDPLSFEDLYKSNFSASELNYELPNLLYQIYMPLAVLANDFTHYDLHSGNVLLYGPLIHQESQENGYIDFHYHLNNNLIIQFPSRYIAKIIDYGRAYYRNDSINASSSNTYQEICNIRECDPDCGKYKGFKYLTKKPLPDEFVASRFKNISHDLRLFKITKDELSRKGKTGISISLKLLLSKIKYDDSFGTSEDLNTFSGQIRNVFDASHELANYLSTPSFEKHKESMYTNPDFRKIGEFHIYEDRRPMTFREEP
jgi:hypothetical protein